MLITVITITKVAIWNIYHFCVTFDLSREKVSNCRMVTVNRVIPHEAGKGYNSPAPAALFSVKNPKLRDWDVMLLACMLCY